MNDPSTHDGSLLWAQGLIGMTLWNSAHFLSHFLSMFVSGMDGLEWFGEKIIHLGSAFLVVVAVLKVVSHWLHRPHGHGPFFTRVAHFARLFAAEMKRTGVEA